MRIVLFCHSLRSDWNHGNAHFLRGVVSELLRRGHEVSVYEPADAWSVKNLREDHGEEALHAFRSSYPQLSSHSYQLEDLSLDQVLDGVDLVIVHEWNDPQLVQRVGRHRSQHHYLLLFHDTHHRMVSQPREMERYDLTHYDGVLAFGEVLRKLYLERRLVRMAFTWHEAADVRVFSPASAVPAEGPCQDLTWIGNWGDDERTAELEEYLLAPARELGLTGSVHGVRYPEKALRMLASTKLRYLGWLPNYRAPAVFARHACTVHVPRGPYVRDLPGVPTIRVFEALACGIPLVSAPWRDDEALFEPGRDFLMARNGQHMTSLLRELLHEPELRASLRNHGLATIHARHTCAHRVDELLAICELHGTSAKRTRTQNTTRHGESACPTE
jgi:spore maturation protein CgeB